MSYDGWLEYNGLELVNLSRTAQLAESLGIDVLWTDPESVQWIEDALGGSDYDAVSTAPWYDDGVPESGEFAGIVPLSITGLDDSTLEATTVEYITDGGSSGKGRNKTLTIVANVALIGSTTRGVEFGKRWMDRMLRSAGAGQFCSGSDLRYFRYRQDEGLPVPPIAHRRDVSLTRGASVTRKTETSCATMWMATFTVVANDPFEYGEPIHLASNVGGTANSGVGINSAVNPTQTQWGTNDERISRFGNTIANHWGSTSTPPDAPDTYTRATEVSSGPGRGLDWYGNTQNINPGVSGEWLKQPVEPGEIITISHYTRWTFTGSLIDVRSPLRFHDGVGNWVTPISIVSLGSLAGKSGQWVRYSRTFTVPAGARYLTTGNWASGDTAIGDTLDQTAILIERSSQASPLLPQGRLLHTMSSCPAYDYTPIYDPLHPALVPAPEPPDFYPTGWALLPGVALRRCYATVDAPEPSALGVVPVITLRSRVEARMLRVQLWPGGSASAQCEPLWEAVVSYLPPNVDFVIDGEQQASYAWDRLSPAVRRTDSLVFGADARPVDWRSFTPPDSILIAFDAMGDADGIEYDGDSTVGVDLTLVPKSD